MRKITTLIVFALASTLALSACASNAAHKTDPPSGSSAKATSSAPTRQVGTHFETTPVPWGLLGKWTAVSVMGVPTKTFRPATFTLNKWIYPKSPGYMDPMNGSADDTCNVMDFAAAFSPGDKVRMYPGFITAVGCLKPIPDFFKMFNEVRSYSATIKLNPHGISMLSFYDSTHTVIGVFTRQV